MSADPSSTTEEYGDMRERMTRVEVKLDGLGGRVDLVLAQLSGIHVDHEQRIRTLEQRADPVGVDHESRLRKLERALWLTAGGAATVGGGLGAWLSSVLN